MAGLKDLKQAYDYLAKQGVSNPGPKEIDHFFDKVDGGYSPKDNIAELFEGFSSITFQKQSDLPFSMYR